MERIHPVYQDRAQRTAAALAEAAHELMEARPFDEVTVTEIVERASSSVGAFYARFGCKEALLDWLCQSVLAREGEGVRERLLALESGGTDLEGLVRAYVELVTEFFEANAVLLREVMRFAYGRGDREALRQTVLVNREVDRTCVSVLLARRDDIGHLDPEGAVASVPGLVAGMLRGWILLEPMTRTSAAGPTAAERREELVQWILCALRVQR